MDYQQGLVLLIFSNVNKSPQCAACAILLLCTFSSSRLWSETLIFVLTSWHNWNCRIFGTANFILKNGYRAISARDWKLQARTKPPGSFRKEINENANFRYYHLFELFFSMSFYLLLWESVMDRPPFDWYANLLLSLLLDISSSRPSLFKLCIIVPVKWYSSALIEDFGLTVNQIGPKAKLDSTATKITFVGFYPLSMQRILPLLH